jgi:hypothetical protein
LTTVEPNADTLEDQIKEMLKNPIEPKYRPYPIRVSGKVIQQISTGIYRSPGNVVKELVSNAFDADAKLAIVRTDVPNFGTFSMYDTGLGMTPEEFVVRMSNIGSSMKATSEKTPSGRPVIGKVGIGLLSAAHIARQFTVISGKEDESQGFEAKVDMSRFFGPEAESHPMEELNAGSVMVRVYAKSKEAHYTRIRAEQTSPTWKEQLGRDWDESYFNATEPTTFKTFVVRLQEDQARVKRLAGYDQLLWELGLLCPVPYLKDGPVVGSQLQNIIQLRDRIQGYNFKLVVDATTIKKPFLLPAASDSLSKQDYRVYPIDIETEADGNKITATGYIYHQAVRINPPELRGILPRIRNVGIGLPSYNMFRVLTESPVISYQVFGELYVDRGLDNALNIDRSSFFEADPSFGLIVQTIEETLKRSEIIGDIRARQNERSAARKQGSAEFLVETLHEIAEEGGINKPKLKFRSEKSERPLMIDWKSGEIEVFTRGVKKKDRNLFFGLLLCYELARRSSNQDKLFYELVQSLLEMTA